MIMKTFEYPLEEFFSHVGAMPVVGKYEEAFISYDHPPVPVGDSKTFEAQTFRIIDYLSQSIDDRDEQIYKAVRLQRSLSYISEHKGFFAQAGLMTTSESPAEPVTVEGSLLQAVHAVFCQPDSPLDLDPAEIAVAAKKIEAEYDDEEDS
jgi:hypothetical protein